MRLLINAGIQKIIYIDDYNDDFTDKLAFACSIELIKYKERSV
jgi:deoxycytidylate deaminase